MEDYKQKGDVLMDEMKQLLNPANHNPQRMIDLLSKASTYYKLAKLHSQTANVFVMLGDLYCTTSHNNYQAAINFRNAGDNFVLAEDYEDAKINFDKASKLFLEEGKFSSAAKIVTTVADMLNNQKMFNEAIAYYTKAYDYYLMENSASTACSNLLKAAYLMLEMNRYQETNKCLETVYNYYINHDLTVFKCRELMLHIGIIDIYLQDIKGCKIWLDNCKKQELKNCREFIFLSSIVDACEKEDSVAITNSFNEFKSVSPLHPRITKCLEEIIELMNKK